MMFSGYPRPGICHAHFHAVGARQAEPAPLFRRSHASHASFPEMRRRAERDAAASGGMLQSIVKKISGHLLHLLIIETERGDGRIKTGIEFHPFALKGFRPAFRKLIQAIPEVILA